MVSSKRGISISTRMSILIGVLLIIIYTIFGALLVKKEKARLIEQASAWFRDDLNDFEQLFDVVESETDNGFTNSDYEILSPILKEKSYFGRGYPVLVRLDGLYLIHPTKEGESGAGSIFHEKKIKSNQNEGSFRYKYPDNKGEWKYQYYKYYEPYDAFIVETYYEKDLLSELKSTKRFIVFGLAISILIVVLGVVVVTSGLIVDIKKIIKAISMLALGKNVKSLSVRNNDEIGQITEELNKLIVGIENTATFAAEIGNGNLEAEIKLLSDGDELGKALVEMRDNLKNAAEEERKRQAEDKQRQWYNEGIARFSEIVRKHDDFTKLSTEFIIQLVKYLELNQGGIFLLNDDDKNNKYFELVAAYAYDRQKHLDKKVGLEDGYIGACYLEKQTVYLKNVPDDYVQITSGLGQATPKYLVIIPIKTEEDVLGVIELASFEEIPQYYAEFVEKIAENIAASYSSMKINKQTQKLLEESRLQSQQMIEQEEEMRQNMEELQATQEESSRTEEMLRKELAEAKQTISELKSQLNN